MKAEGIQIIGHTFSTPQKKEGGFYAVNPATGKKIDQPTFHDAEKEEMDEALRRAKTAFEIYRSMTNSSRAAFLRAAADEINAIGDLLTETAMAETGLPKGRLDGERGRTTNQLRMFAEFIENGYYVNAIIDKALPDRNPPRSDIRRMNHPLGPVVVFGASNFPLAFSVAGGDTASALAAGCPVVVKAHPAHPATSELVGKAIIGAAKKTGMPDGVFSLVQGISHEIGGYLVSHPLTAAVGFTGSFRGGKALYDLAQKRAVPIPVYAEMGSTNPVFILPGAIAAQGEKVAQALTHSINLGAGQFCTNPGVFMVKEDDQTPEFTSKLISAFTGQSGQVMLTEGIHEAYRKGTEKLKDAGRYKVLARGEKGSNPWAGEPVLFHTNYKDVKEDPNLTEEVFGPSSIMVSSTDDDEILEFARSLDGHLTATVHATEEDKELVSKLLPILQEKVGRIIFNGYPTGVEVCHAMVHGGPFPSTTFPSTTSVGTDAIHRFLRPVCYQDTPDEFLPPALQEKNPLKIWRLVNGEWTKS